MDITDRVCKLECIKGVKEFVGPVKITLVDPPEGEYCLKTCSAGLIALANMLMGALNVIVMLYTSSFRLTLFNNLHVLLCTIGFQLCIPSGILMMNRLNGASGPLKESDRKCQHLFLQLVGMGCAVSGAVLVFLLGETSQDKYSVHFYAGCVSCGFCLLSMLVGPVSYYIKSEGTAACIFKSTHAFFGVLAFLASSVCFILGIFKKAFTSWLSITETKYILMLFCGFYTLIVIYTPIRKYLLYKRDS